MSPGVKLFHTELHTPVNISRRASARTRKEMYTALALRQLTQSSIRHFARHLHNEDSLRETAFGFE